MNEETNAGSRGSLAISALGGGGTRRLRKRVEALISWGKTWNRENGVRGYQAIPLA